MVGNKIYLVFCRYGDNQDRLETPHATFDGAYEHMQAIKKHFIDKDFNVAGFGDGSFIVTGPYGFKRMYYVATRTIEK